ncbi:MAG: cytidylate kinase-like family protein [Bacteroidales bacterium]|nr:cytidylate kinase-like family protein [Bacteroidales bacterium]MBR4498767.1 cytidylate kinase-like family protein [Bacteroidales bacterium]
MEQIVISIGRQFGSGGRIIGKALAEKLNIDYYDNELLVLAAKQNGLAPEFFESNDEISNSLFGFASNILDNIGLGTFTNNMLSGDTLFQMQSETIKKLASEKSCIIVGRCSDYILRDNPNCVSIFLHASEEERAKRIANRMNISEEEALAKLVEADKKRASYYNFYSNKTWGESKTYDLSINVSKLGIEGTLNFILDYLKMRFPDKF